MKIAAIQLRSGVDISDNIDVASTLIHEAASAGATFIATPEMTHNLQRSSRKLFATIQPQSGDPGVEAFSALADELGVFLLIGSLAIKTGENRAANRSFLFGPDGRIVATYDKIHLFDVSVSEEETWKESRIYDAGDRAVTADIEGAKLGLSICYDLRFPGLYRDYAQAGAEIITIPAAFTRPTGEAHWEPLLRARAIETGSFVIAPAQGGKHEDGRSTWGHSMIISPWGDILASFDHDEPGFISVDIDLNDVATARQKIPAWTHNPDYRV